MFSVQKTMVEAWSIVDDAFFDSSFGGKDWESELGNALMAAYRTEEPGSAYVEIGRMLQVL